LIHDLSNKYGKQRGFKDTALFSEIEHFTYPEIRQFLDKYVAGPERLPYADIFNIVGVKYQAEGEDSVFSLGRVSLGFDQKTGRIIVNDTAGMNEVGHTLGYHKGDLWLTLNGKDIDAANQRVVIPEFYKSSKLGDSLLIKVLRKNASGGED